MELRNYQQKAVDALTEHFKKKKSGCLVLPTGSGKTFTAWQFLKQAIDKKQKMLWVVHREYLIDQALSAIRMIDKDVPVTKWIASEKDSSGDIVLAMIMSTKELTDEFHWLIYDECHRSAANSYIELEKRIKFKKKLGLTATSERLDEKELRLGEIVFQTRFGDLVEDGYLAKPEVLIIKTGQALQLTTSFGDISSNVLKKVNNSSRNSLIADALLNKKEKPGKSLIFCVDINHATNLSETLNQHGGNSTVVHSKLTPAERISRLDQFRNNEVQFLCNCEVFTEGYDEPDIESIVMARPTLSKLLWVQMVGRGARPVEGKKDKFKLWVFLDDIDKYSWLVREWALTEMDQVVDSEIKDQKKHLENVDKVSKEFGIADKLPKSHVERLKIIGMVRTCGTFKDAKPIAHTMTEERYACLVMLNLYFSTIDTDTDGAFRKDMIEMSYSYCVTAGEFSLHDWKEIAWSFYWYFIKQNKTNLNNKSIWASSWIFKPLISKKKAQEKFIQNVALNKAFNALAEEKTTLGQTIYVENLIRDHIPKYLWHWGFIQEARLRNRCVIFESTNSVYKMGTKHFTDKVIELIRNDFGDDNITIHYRLRK